MVSSPGSKPSYIWSAVTNAREIMSKQNHTHGQVSLRNSVAPTECVVLFCSSVLFSTPLGLGGWKARRHRRCSSLCPTTARMQICNYLSRDYMRPKKWIVLPDNGRRRWRPHTSSENKNRHNYGDWRDLDCEPHVAVEFCWSLLHCGVFFFVSTRWTRDMFRGSSIEAKTQTHIRYILTA